MATLTKQTFDESGSDLTMSAASAGGDQFANSGDLYLLIVNNDTSSKTVTVTAQTTSYEFGRSGAVVKQDQALTVSANGGVGLMGPFPKNAFNDSSGNVQVTYSAVTSLEVAVVDAS